MLRTLEERNALVLQWSGIAIQVAEEFYVRSKYRQAYDFDDLIQEGKEALIRAAEDYDPNHRNEMGLGASFYTFARRYVRTAIINLRSRVPIVWVPRATMRRQTSMPDRDETAKRKAGRPRGRDPKTTGAIRVATRHIASVHGELRFWLIAPPPRIDPAEWREALAMIDHLPEKQREAIRCRYVVGLDLRDMALLFGITKHAVNVRLHTAIKNLRNLAA